MPNNPNDKFHVYVANEYTLEKELISFISDEYEFLQGVLGGKTFQSGSYGRGTAINPINDLDIIWILPSTIRKSIDLTQLDITNILVDLANQLVNEYANKGKNVSISPQKHSVLIEFPERDDEFSIDVVPAIELDETNEYLDNYFLVPEVGLEKRVMRKLYYDKHNQTSNWVKTDPKGYISATKEIDNSFDNFKDVVKIVKAWKKSWKEKAAKAGILEMKLKSFHLEQLVYRVLLTNHTESSMKLLLEVMKSLAVSFDKPEIKDRAQEVGLPIRYIDAYVEELSNDQKDYVKFAANCALELFRNYTDENLCENTGDFLDRLLSPEEFIAAYGFRLDSETSSDQSSFKIDGRLKPKQGLISGSLRNCILLKQGLTRGKDFREIEFSSVVNKFDGGYSEYWKVRNAGPEARKAKCLRGEITKNRTMQYPEKTAYIGTHFVNCYLVDEQASKVLAIDEITVTVR